jgi:hypothetical protein
MADITPSRIEPLGDGSTDSQPGNPQREPAVKPKLPVAPVPDPPAIADEKESHQLDELA